MKSLRKLNILILILSFHTLNCKKINTETTIASVTKPEEQSIEKLIFSMNYLQDFQRMYPHTVQEVVTKRDEYINSILKVLKGEEYKNNKSYNLQEFFEAAILASPHPKIYLEYGKYLMDRKEFRKAEICFLITIKYSSLENDYCYVKLAEIEAIRNNFIATALYLQASYYSGFQELEEIYSNKNFTEFLKISDFKNFINILEKNKINFKSEKLKGSILYSRGPNPTYVHKTYLCRNGNFFIIKEEGGCNDYITIGNWKLDNGYLNLREKIHCYDKGIGKPINWQSLCAPIYKKYKMVCEKKINLEAYSRKELTFIFNGLEKNEYLGFYKLPKSAKEPEQCSQNYSPINNNAYSASNYSLVIE